MGATSGAIARNIGIAILSGRYKPGQILVGEIASSEVLNVSHTAYREAIRILAAKGLVISKPKVGTKVAERSKWYVLDPDVLAWAFETDPSVEMINGLFELRDIVESAAAGYAVLRRTGMQLDSMRTALEEMRRHTLETEEGRSAGLNFYRTLMQATKNPFIISLAEAFGAAIVTTVTYKYRKCLLRRDPFPDHLKVFEGISEGNSVKAQCAMHELVQKARLDTTKSAPIKRRQTGATRILVSGLLPVLKTPS